MPIPTNVTTLPLTVQIVARLVVANTMGLPDAPPVAVNMAGAAPNTTGVVGAKAVIACGAGLMTMLAVTWGAAL